MQPEQPVGVLDFDRVADLLADLQQLLVQLLLNVDQFRPPPELAEDRREIDRLPAADERRTVETQLVRQLRIVTRFVGELARFGEPFRVHLQIERLFHEFDRALELLGQMLDRERIVRADRRGLKREETVRKPVVAPEVAENPFALLARL